MKKAVTLLICAMVSLSLFGCGNKDEIRGDTTIQIGEAMYYNTKEAVLVEPDESVIVRLDTTADKDFQNDIIEAYAILNKGDKDEMLVGLIGGEWYKFVEKDVTTVTGDVESDLIEEQKSAYIEYGTSSIYSKEDMSAAINVILEEFNTWEGCELHSISYSSDEECNNAENIRWMNDLEKANDNKEEFTQCIMFNSSFRSPINGGGAWNANEEYTWSWWLGRSEGGDWKLMTWGY